MRNQTAGDAEESAASGHHPAIWRNREQLAQSLKVPVPLPQA
ncbi:hypothetical protein [Cupriavidus sp. IDO]|nr:hypothetical protein [Cupriavidus sp. IDO]